MAEERLQVQRRAVLGKQVNRLRRRGVLPAVIFGHGDSIPIQVDAHEFRLGYRRWGRTTLITLSGIDGDIPVLVHGISRSPRTGEVLHADFFRVSLTERVHAEVPVHFVGESLAVKNLGAVLIHALDHLRVEAFPQDIPHRIDVDLAALVTLDDVIHVSDIVIETTKIRLLNDSDELVVKVVPQRVEEVALPPPAPEAEAAAPEAAAPEGTTPTGAAGQTQQPPPAQQPKK